MIFENFPEYINDKKFCTLLDAIVGDIVYQHFEGKREGFLTNTRSKIVQRETLNKLAVEIGLDKLIKYSTRSSFCLRILCGLTARVRGQSRPYRAVSHAARTSYLGCAAIGSKGNKSERMKIDRRIFFIFCFKSLQS